MTGQTRNITRYFPSLPEALMFFAYATGATRAFIPRFLIARLEDLQSREEKLDCTPEKVLRLIRQANKEGVQVRRSHKVRVSWKPGSSPNGYTISVLSSVASTMINIIFEAIPIKDRANPCIVTLTYETKLDSQLECSVNITGNSEGVKARLECGDQRKVLG
jgi:hypothetical protein